VTQDIASSELTSKLASVSWDFAGAQTNTGPHKIHPYPARFIPQIPHALIDLLHPGDNSPVLDPFCGSGTTLVEAVESGLPAVGIDLHPLATLIAKVKTTPIDGAFTRVACETTVAARQRILEKRVLIPAIPRVDHWFQAHVKEALAALVAEIDLVKEVNIEDALRVALSSIIVRVSNQDSDTRYAAVEKNVSQESVFDGFDRATAAVASALSNNGRGLFSSHEPQVRIITKDILKVEPHEVGDGIGLVITSPPYPNAYEYWLYHKYRMYWLGMDPIAVRDAEIGARPHYFKVNHQTEEDFEQQMGRCFWLLSKVMRRGAYACFVIGRSIIHSREIDNEALLERAAMPHGFRKAASVPRNIATNKKSFNLSHGTINREAIVVFILEDA
jgi:site-specific DNA-methyltransferase (cytosine-N4-specific)